tara:strand:- start:383 stop:1552 length:1170 start_codon:yes stop_codon:yes gene_type:complete
MIGCSTVEPPDPIGYIPTVEVPTPTIEGGIEVEVSQNSPSLVTPTIDPVPTPTPGPTSTAVPYPTITSSLTPTPTPTFPAPSQPRIAGSVQFEVDVATVVSETELSEQGFSRINAPALMRLKDGRYRLYLQSRVDTSERGVSENYIISSISSDGVDWTLESGPRIISGGESDIDSECGEPEVFLGLDDKYYMAYTGRFKGLNPEGKEQNMHRLVFAVSDDGLNWTKLDKHYSDPLNRNDFASSADVHVIDGKYLMYYTGQRNIIRASSEDGLTWVREQISIEAGHDSSMVMVGERYYQFVRMPEELVYRNNPDLDADRVIMLISKDGINWSNNYYKVKVRDSDGNKIVRIDMRNPGAIVLPDGSLRVFLSVDKGGNIYSIKPVEPLPLE